MKIKFEDIKEGDKVRLTREGTDELIEFTVSGVREDVVFSKSTAFSARYNFEVELLNFKPVPGIYTNPSTPTSVVVSESGQVWLSRTWVSYRHNHKAEWDDETNRVDSKESISYHAVREFNHWKRTVTF